MLVIAEGREFDAREKLLVKMARGQASRGLNLADFLKLVESSHLGPASSLVRCAKEWLKVADRPKLHFKVIAITLHLFRG